MPKDKTVVNASGKAVFYAILYADFRRAALDCGYALALHGSMVNDMDMIAVPWVENPVPVTELVAKISDCIGGTVWAERHCILQETRPHGRQIYTMSIMRDFVIDLSVIAPHPAASQPSPAVQEGEPEDIKQWIMNWSREEYEIVYDDDAHAMAVEADRHIARGAMKAMYHKMQDEVDCLKSEIMGYKTVVKDFNESVSSLQSQLYNTQKERDDYREAVLSEIRAISLFPQLKDQYESLLKIIGKYPIPQTPNNE